MIKIHFIGQRLTRELRHGKHIQRRPRSVRPGQHPDDTVQVSPPLAARCLNRSCRMEDSIIFSLIERAQYPINPVLPACWVAAADSCWSLQEVYQADSPLLSEFVRHQLRTSGSNGCYADRFLYRVTTLASDWCKCKPVCAQTECLHAEAGRYIHPTEHSFFAPLPDPLIGNQRPMRSQHQPEAFIV